jgi:hypothetical protein
MSRANDPHAHEGKGKGAVEFFVAIKRIDLLRRENFTEPSLKHPVIGGGPIGGLNLATRAKAWTLPHTKMDIRMSCVMGGAQDGFQG